MADGCRHYSLHWRDPYVEKEMLACGGTDFSCTVGVPTLLNRPITCPACLASQEYQEDVTTVEIAFDGDWRAWLRSLPTFYE